ncbi:MAG: class I SAM-dependent methyltransferase [bacterium]|nr:class I SAM-dependent methyltransferase [bacterium]
MQQLQDDGGSGYDPDQYWQDTEDSYPHYPTVRHRKRFILNMLQKHRKGNDWSVFDFGCGEGTLLKTIQEKFRLQEDNVGGCDISKQAVDGAMKKLNSPHISNELYPTSSKTYDVMLCSEVVEHTTQYEKILRWMAEHTSPGGIMIVTTQAGRIHASDNYTGHTQHFQITALSKLIEDLGLQIVKRRLWGWPLFTLQKYLTNVQFQKIQDSYLEGGLTLRKRIVFGLTYCGYMLHDVIPFGPQIYIVAKKV